MTFRSRPLLDLAKGQSCRANVPNVCNRDSATVVSCHKPVAAGMGLKQPDHLIAFCCSACHDFIDARTHLKEDKATRLWYWQYAHEATMEYLFSAGLLTVAGHKERVVPFKRHPKILPRNPEAA